MYLDSGPDLHRSEDQCGMLWSPGTENCPPPPRILGTDPPAPGSDPCTHPPPHPEESETPAPRTPPPDHIHPCNRHWPIVGSILASIADGGPAFTQHWRQSIQAQKLTFRKTSTTLIVKEVIWSE